MQKIEKEKETNWTIDQTKAITQKDNNILVSAAAGSGKTAVLVERVIRKIIDEQIDLDKLLIVTFTNAAASEMREKILNAIYKELEKDPENSNLNRQLVLINKANISTIHSFCLDVIKNNFFEIDCSANFRVAEESETILLKQDVLDDIFENKYNEQDKEFINLMEKYCKYNNEEEIREIILKIFEYIQGMPFPLEWLHNQIEKYNEDITNFGDTEFGKIILNFVSEFLEESINTFSYFEQRFKEIPEYECLVNSFDIDANELVKMLNLCEERKWDEIYETINSFTFQRWKSPKGVDLTLAENAKNAREKIKDTLKKYKTKYFSKNTKAILEDMKDIYTILKEIEELVKEFSDRFAQEKKERNIVDFNDIEHFALKILVKKDENGKIEKTEVAKNYEKRFEEVAIDEYQDTNYVQEMIINSVSNGHNLFMVGDIKQSIYKFRNSRPEIFKEKYIKYINSNEGKRIKLFDNFRSRDSILKITNYIFENIMSEELGDVEYNEEEFLKLGASFDKVNVIPELNIIDLKTDDNLESLDNIEEDDDEQEDDFIETSFDDNSNNISNKNNNEEDYALIKDVIEKAEIEATFVVNKIKELKESNYRVYDLKKEEYRDLKYRDIVILLRSTKDIAPIYEKKILEANIPVFSDTSSEYLNSNEIQTIISLLKIIDNPFQDIPLVCVLRSPIGNFNDNELVEIKTKTTDKKLDENLELMLKNNSSFYVSLIKALKIEDISDELKNKINNILNLIDRFKKENSYKPLDELIWDIYIKTNYFNYVGLLNNGNLRQANLKLLFEKARTYENSSFKGLYNFVNFIEKLQLSSKDMGSAKIIGENDDCVRIMSIHKSKGLEFPIVFLCGTGKKINMMDLTSDLLLDSNLGIGIKYRDYEIGLEYSTIIKRALELKLKPELVSEEERVLYVALTRAKEKLIITGIDTNFEKNIEYKRIKLEQNNNEISNNFLQEVNKSSYLDWMEYIWLKDKKEFEKRIKINYFKSVDILAKTRETIDVDSRIRETLDSIAENPEVLEEIKKKLNWEYEYISSTKIPTKSSVSAITKSKEDVKAINDEYKEDEEELINIYEDKNNNDNDNENKSENNISLNTPSWLEKETITPAKKGTLIHLILKLLNFDKNIEYEYEDISKFVNNLVEKETISKEEAEAIDINKIYKFTKSDIYKEILDAKEIHKEQPFYISIPAKEIPNNIVNFDNDEIRNKNEDNILVQGIIDLYFVNKDGKIILLDYKTDKIYEGQDYNSVLKERYKGQINLYKEAIEKSLNKEVYKSYIYSLDKQKLIEI